MTFFYDAGIRLYFIVAWLISPFNKKADLWVKGRKNIFQRLFDEIPKNAKIAWFHASSLGEFEQGRPIMEALRTEMPEYKILLTFFSPSGYEIRKDFKGADFIYYLPLDTKRNAKKFLQIVNPTLTLFIKYEFWYHFLHQLKKSRSKVILVSAIFRPEQMFFKWYGSWYRKVLSCFDHCFVQDSDSAKLLANINIANVTLSGDTRFDRVSQLALRSGTIGHVEQFAANHFTFVCGSTWEKDELLLTAYINQTSTNCRFIIAPHEISASKLKSLKGMIHKNAVFFSEINNTSIQHAQVIIIDNIGMLSSLYKYGQVAYIGGGFGAGIHNVLEAAVYGMPVVFGPNYSKFREARELILAGSAYSVTNYSAMEQIFDSWQKNHDLLTKASVSAKNYVLGHLGATGFIIDFLKKN